jgi:cytidylate kinase
LRNRALADVAQRARRVHVTGGPGSGKTHLARRLAAARSIPVHDLDALMLGAGDRFDRLSGDGMVAELTGLPEWVSDGVYFGWASPFLERADLVVWLDIPPHVALYRMVARHVRLEVTRRNRFPGWRRFYRFWRWAARYYAERNEPGIDHLGIPNTRSTVETALAPYADKLVVCRSNREAADFLAGLCAGQDHVS